MVRTKATAKKKSDSRGGNSDTIRRDGKASVVSLYDLKTHEPKAAELFPGSGSIIHENSV